MPNPDGTPTMQELFAAQQSAPALSAALPADRAGTPDLQSQLAAFAPPPAPVSAAPANAPPPQYATKLTPLQMTVANSGLNLPPGLAGGTPMQPEHGLQARVAAGSTATGGAPITYKATTPQSGENLQAQAARGFMVPFNVGGRGAGGGKASTPFANQLRTLKESEAGAGEVKAMSESDTAFNRDMLGRDVQQANAAIDAQEAQHAEHRARLEGAKNAYARTLEDAPAESIDAERWWASRDTGKGIAAALSTALSGFAAGWQGRGGNEALDNINRAVDRDIEVQRANIAERARAGAVKQQGAKTAYEMIREGVHDDQAAADLTKAWTLDRAALEMKQRALLTQDVQTQAGYQEKIDAMHMTAAQLQDKAAQALAQGGPAGFDRAKYLAQLNHYTAMGIPSDQAEMQAARDLGYSRGGGPVEKREGGAASKMAEKQLGSDEYNQQMSALKKSPVLDKLGLQTAVSAKFGQRLAPESTMTEQQLEALNTQAMQGLLKTAKDAEGKPNVAMIERYEARFKINPGDTREVALAKLQGIQDVVNGLARQEGANAPTPTAGRAAPSLQQQVAGFRPAGQ